MAITSRFHKQLWACSLTSVVSANRIHAEKKMSKRLAFIHAGSHRWFARKHVRGSNALLAAVVIAFAMSAMGGEPCAPTIGTQTAREPTVGQFTGKLVDGKPVY